MPRYKICLDPGHGGTEFGAVGSMGTKEKDINLAVAKTVEGLLKQANIDVKMTRTTDETVSLEQRVNIANTYNADYFISIHCNAYTSDSHGTETYCYKYGGKGEILAKAIQEALISSIKLADRGIKEGNYYVLRLTNMPAVLTELAFLSNPEEEKLLLSPEFQNKCAEAIARAIKKTLGIQSNEPVIDEAWQWALEMGLFKNEHKYKAVQIEDIAKAMYKLHGSKPNTTKYTKQIIDGVLVIEIEPMILKCKDMVLKTGKELAKEYKNFTNGNFFLWEHGQIKKTIGWLISEGNILSSRYEHKEFGWAGNPKGTFLVYKNGTVEVGWKWDSDIEKVEKDIWFCVQGFNLYPPKMTIRDGLVKEGWTYDSVAYRTNRLAIGYNPATKKVVITVEKNSNAEQAIITTAKFGCEGNAICLDSGLSCNAVVDGEEFITTDRQLANIIYW